MEEEIEEIIEEEEDFCDMYYRSYQW